MGRECPRDTPRSLKQNFLEGVTFEFVTPRKRGQGERRMINRQITKKILDSPQEDRVKSDLLCDGVVCPEGRRLLFFWAAVHGGLGRARRPRVAVSSDAAPSTCSGVDCHRPRSTKNATKSGLAGLFHGLRDPTRTAVACVRSVLPSLRTTRLTNQRSAPPGDARIGQPRPGLPPSFRAEVRDRPYASARGRRVPGARAPETVLVRRLGAPPVRRLFLIPGRDHDCFTLIRPAALACQAGPVGTVTLGVSHPRESTGP
jgi:hypothetical protein